MRIAGVVLAGGRSVRFGRDKALELLGGQPLIYWALEALRPSAAVLAINGPPALGVRFGLPSIEDFPGVSAGPLAGLLSAMDWAGAQGCSRVLTSPCDTPLLPRDMAFKLAAAAEAPVVAARAARVHALCALWRVDLADRLVPFARQPDQPSLHRIIDALGGLYVDFPDEAAFANLNTQAELAAARRRWTDQNGR
jgi:molybdopterin-guanine dinucleotide biosynthesis protein A